MNQNDYIELAARSFNNLLGHLDQLSEGFSQTRRRDLEESLLDEIRLVWTRLAWADGRIGEGEEALLQRIAEVAKARGLQFAPYRHPDLGTLPVFLQLASEESHLAAAYMISQIETFGFALLAADGQVGGAELQLLGEYLHRRREQTLAPSSAAERVLQLA